MSGLAVWFGEQTLELRMEAARRLAAVSHAQALWEIGLSRAVADIFAAVELGCSPGTIRAWRNRLTGLRCDDPAALHSLCPRRRRRRIQKQGERE